MRHHSLAPQPRQPPSVCDTFLLFDKLLDDMRTLMPYLEAPDQVSASPLYAFSNGITCFDGRARSSGSPQTEIQTRSIPSARACAGSTSTIRTRSGASLYSAGRSNSVACGCTISQKMPPWSAKTKEPARGQIGIDFDFALRGNFERDRLARNNPGAANRHCEPIQARLMNKWLHTASIGPVFCGLWANYAISVTCCE